jgi:cytochrome c oxidase subunit 3
MWVVLAAIVMMFAALSSAYIILSGGQQWRPVSMPRMFFLSTGIILASSFSLETAKRSLNQGRQNRSFGWLVVTLALGVTFITCQLMGWRELAAQGVYFASHPHSSFFYFFTGVHGVHLLGGLAALLYLIVRVRLRRAVISEKTEIATQMVSLYWHTMDALWLWLFLLLLIWK